MVLAISSQRLWAYITVDRYGPKSILAWAVLVGSIAIMSTGLATGFDRLADVNNGPLHRTVFIIERLGVLVGGGGIYMASAGSSAFKLTIDTPLAN